jgi:hypothetical protein
MKVALTDKKLPAVSIPYDVLILGIQVRYHLTAKNKVPCPAN